MQRAAAGSWCCCLHRPAARWCCCLHRSQKRGDLGVALVGVDASERCREAREHRVRGRILVKDRVSSPPCVEGSSKILSARLVWRVADQRIALLPAMHIDERPEVGARGWRGRPSPPHAQRLMAASGESPPELTSAPRCLAAHMLAPRYAPRCLAAHMLAPRYL